jgi:hypothetical protein
MPLGPPDRAMFGAAAAAPPGGAASGLLYAILVAVLVVAARELRRHRPRFIYFEPTGFVSPHPRPG